jgi:putative tricarboxylic transport membrane protein
MRRRALLPCTLPLVLPGLAAPARALQCVVPAKPGGGFDITCRLAQLALAPAPGAVAAPLLPVVHQPGGIGALVFNEVVAGRRATSRELVAFSSGTLLMLAQGRMGRHPVDAVRWLAALAQDHGVVAVHRDAPWQRLPELLQALAANPAAVVLAGGGTLGSQDWLKSARLARAAGVGHRAFRFVAFEGGGDALQALRGRHVQVLAGDAAEISEPLRQGQPLRLLAVLSERRLAGLLAHVPTAREQGVDLVWPILRGVYTSHAMAAVEADGWANQLLAGQRQPRYEQLLAGLSLQAQPLAGEALEREVRSQWDGFRRDAAEFGLR